MAENTPVTLVPANFPPDYCPRTWQQLANDLGNGMSGFVPGAYSFFNYGTSEPAVNDRNKPWFRLNPDGTPDKWYVFANGGWVSPHTCPAGGDERRLFVGAESDAWAYDGGDGADPGTTPPGDASGAMWEVDHDFDFRFPIGPGTSPAPLSTTINVGDVGGEEEHELTRPELPDVGVKLFTDEEVPGNNALGGVDFVARAATSPGGDFEYRMQPATGSNEPVSGVSESMGDGEGHNNMPPYRGAFMIKRTARLFYVP